MNKQLETILVPVSVKERLPEDNEWYSVMDKHKKRLGSDQLPFQPEVAFWLESQQRILLTAEEWEMVQKMEKSLKEMMKYFVTIKGWDANKQAIYNRAEQSLSQLNKSI